MYVHIGKHFNAALIYAICGYRCWVGNTWTSHMRLVHLIISTIFDPLSSLKTEEEQPEAYGIFLFTYVGHGLILTWT